MDEFMVYDEVQDGWSADFVDGFMPVALNRLRQHLGRTGDEVGRVVLSTREEHTRRFPERSGEASALLDNETGDEPLGASQYAWSNYAHGVTTKSRVELDPPADLPLGATTVFLDVESIVEAAQSVSVLDEAMLARVLVHELAHVARGHASEEGVATHGWLKEGDAQRDAWAALTALLGDPRWAGIARSARAAQVRLAQRQPPAYRQFGVDPLERSIFESENPHEPTEWLTYPVRPLDELVREALIEIPLRRITLISTAVPNVGDLVYLADAEQTAGPWVVIASSSDSRLRRSADLAAFETVFAERSKDRSSRPEFVWCRLRPYGELAVVDASVGSRRSGYAWNVQSEVRSLKEKLDLVLAQLRPTEGD
ncbi:MAG: hypothetical protein AB7N61_14945 [Acidimicrobiia bacterium]